MTPLLIFFLPDHDKRDRGSSKKDEHLVSSLSYQNFKVFDDSEATVIYDIDEERQLGLEAVEKQRQTAQGRFKGISLKRESPILLLSASVLGVT